MQNPPNILKILQKPFPEEDSRLGNVKNTALISLFVTFVLYVFQPFGISTIESNKFLICLGFGTSTFISIILHEFLINSIFRLKGKGANWTFGKWILNNIGILFSVSLGNFLFARLLIFGYIQWNLFPYMLYSTFMIGIVPLIVLGRFSLLKQERKYQEIAETIHPQVDHLPEVNRQDDHFIYDIPFRQIKYVEALQNYVKIGYINNEGKLTKHTERATLKYILESTEGSSIVRSHRSFLVNRDAIISVSGNAQGLLLKLSDCDKEIPVSRSYVAVFKN